MSKARPAEGLQARDITDTVRRIKKYAKMGDTISMKLEIALAQYQIEAYGLQELIRTREKGGKEI